MKRAGILLSCATTVLATGLLNGCAMFRTSVDTVEPDKSKPMSANYDYSDMRWLGQAIADDLIAGKILADAQNPPIFVIMGIQNRTELLIDTKAITDTARTQLIQSGKVQFANEVQRDNLLKEQGYQLANCTPETRVAIGKQLGAKYMLTGSLVELRKESGRQVRVSKQEEIYYQLTAEVTDLETGLIAWTTQKERARTMSKPLIGW